MRKEDWLIIAGLGALALFGLMRRAQAQTPRQRMRFIKQVAKEAMAKADIKAGASIKPEDVYKITSMEVKVPEWLGTATPIGTVKVGQTPSVVFVVPYEKGKAQLAVVPSPAVKKFYGWVSEVTYKHPTYKQMAQVGAAPTPSQKILQALYGTKRSLPPSVAPANVVTQRGVATQAKRPINIIEI